MILLELSPKSVFHRLHSKFHLGLMNKDVIIFSRIIYGSRYTILVMLVTTSVAFIVGLAIALPSAYYGGWFDNLMMRLMDVMLRFPYIIDLGNRSRDRPQPGKCHDCYRNCIYPRLCPVSAQHNYFIKEEEYVDAERALGASDLRIILHTILPNIISHDRFMSA